MTTAQAQDDDAPLVEQVARAIFDSSNATYTMGGPMRWESDPEHWRRYARAAIARLSVTTPDTTVLVERRRCTICHAIVASYPEGMCCHCEELPWPLASTANPTGETSNG